MRKAFLLSVVLSASLLTPAPLAQASTGSVLQAPRSTPTPDVLRLTARPGTAAEYRTSLKIDFDVSDLHYEAQPGKTVTAAALAAENVRAKAQLVQMNTHLHRAVTDQVGKLFVRVLPPRDGNPVMLTTVVTKLPDTANASAGGPAKFRSVSVSITLTYDPSGKVIGAAVTSSDPQIQKLYQALDLNTLVRNAQDSGSGSLYGQPLALGQPTTRIQNFPTQGLFQTLFALAGVSGQEMQVQSRPLNIRSTTTYTGQDARGNLSFSQALSADPWTVSLRLHGDSGPGLQMNIRDLTGGSTSVLQPDGVSQSSSGQQRMTMQAWIDLPDEAVRMVMTMTYTVTSVTQLTSLVRP